MNILMRNLFVVL